MNGFELNKIAASVLVAGLIAMISGKVSDILYRPVMSDHEFKGSNNTTEIIVEKEEKLDIQSLMASANADKGKQIFQKCASCHMMQSNGVNKIGPNLWKILGHKIASNKTFNYSKALSALSDRIWTYDELGLFLHKPQKYAPGTKMSFIGIKNPQEIADLIKFIEVSE